MRRNLLWPSVFAGAGLVVLLGLGVWQLQRLEWKQGLIAAIEARATADPVPLAEALRQWRGTGESEYLRVRFQGRFLHAQERHLFAVAKYGPGWHVYTPVVTGEGAIVLVNRGFVPDPLKDPAGRSQGQIAGPHEMTGLVRAPGRQGLFTPENEPGNNVWHWRDLGAMTAGLETHEPGGAVAPFFVDLGQASVPGGWPKGGATRLTLSNRHLEYALTWFGLAATLIAVFAFFVRAERKRR